MISRTYIVDKPFVPALTQPGDWSAWFQDGVPTIYGYVATTPKSMAQTVLASPEPDPLLARWQYGSGRTVAWTSDLTGKWSRDFVTWSRFPGLLTEMVKWTFPQFAVSPYEVSTTVQGNEVSFEVNVTGADAPEELEAIVSSEDGGEDRVQLVQVSPGVYSGTMTVGAPGSFLLNLQGKSGGKPVDGGTGTGFVIPYSPEYRIPSGKQEDMLQDVADLTGGRILDWNEPEAAFQFTAQPQRTLRGWERPLLAAALLLWLADIAVRRLALPWGRMAALAAAAMPWRRRARALAAAQAQPGASASQADDGLARLAARRSRAAAFYGGAGAGPGGAGGNPPAASEAAAAAAPQAPVRPPQGGADPVRSAREAQRTGATPPASPPQEEAGRKSGGAAPAADTTPPPASRAPHTGAPDASAPDAAPPDAAPPGAERLGRLLEAKRRGRR